MLKVIRKTDPESQISHDYRKITIFCAISFSSNKNKLKEQSVKMLIFNFE
jgi:hypothetical protein